MRLIILGIIIQVRIVIPLSLGGCPDDSGIGFLNDISLGILYGKPT